MSNGKKQSNQSASETLAEENAELQSEIRKLKNKILQEKDSTEMAKMQAQIDVLCKQQNRQDQLENEFADRKALYHKRVNARIAKEAKVAKAIADIDNEVEPNPNDVEPKSSAQASEEAKSFHDRDKVTPEDPGQSLRPAGQGKGPSVIEDGTSDKNPLGEAGDSDKGGVS